jgi:hypothetical protein
MKIPKEGSNISNIHKLQFYSSKNMFTCFPQWLLNNNGSTFSFPNLSDRLLGPAHPPYPIRNSFLWVGGGGKFNHEVDHSLKTRAEVKKMQIYTTTFHISS